MNRLLNNQQNITRSAFCLLCLLGLSLLASPAAAQIFGSGPSDSALFDSVINLPADSNFGFAQSIGDDGSTTQLNISEGGSAGSSFETFGSEVNIGAGGNVGTNFRAFGSEVNISGGQTLGSGGAISCLLYTSPSPRDRG